MDFHLSEEQAMFRKVVQDFAREHIKPVAREWEHAGRYPTEIVAEMRMVAEGVKTSGPVVELSARHGVEMPIAEQVAAVISQGKTVPEAITALMQREAKTELYGIRG